MSVDWMVVPVAASNRASPLALPVRRSRFGTRKSPSAA
jgi:hypothetical protein